MPGRYIAAGLYSEVIVNRGSTVLLIILIMMIDDAMTMICLYNYAIFLAVQRR